MLWKDWNEIPTLASLYKDSGDANVGWDELIVNVETYEYYNHDALSVTNV